MRAILGRTHGLLLEAFHTEFDQQVIIKVLPSGWGDEKEIERFRREARTLAKLESEHVARIIDVGSQDDGSFYLVRQFLDGVDLGTFMRQRSQLPLEEAVLLVLQAAEAVAETHSHGIIIRELQPAHLFLTQRAGGAPLLKVVDFGTAKLMRDAVAPTASGELTATAMFGLSPYTSPELVRKAKNVDQRTDVWSLGALLYELVTGRPPFNGDMAVLMLQIAKEEPVPATQYRPDLPVEIDQILGWAMAKDLDGRFRNVHALAHALTPFANSEGRLLIERIGQITHAAKKKKTVSVAPPAAPSGGGYLPPPTPPPGRPRPEDSITSVKSQQQGGMATQNLPAYNPGGGGSPSGFPPPSGAGPRSSRSGAAGRPGSTGGRGEPVPAMGPSTVQPAMLKATPVQPPVKSRKLIYGVLAIAAVLVPILVTIVVLRKPGGGASATDDPNKPIEIPVTTSGAPSASMGVPESATPPVPPSTAEPTAPEPSASASAASSAEPVASGAPTATPASSGAVAYVPPSGTRGSSSSSNSGSSGSSSSSGVRTSSGSKETKETEPSGSSSSSSGGGGNGTIVAVASGGSCSFTVNGASKGSGTSVRVSVSPGTYSVSCKPSGSAAKSKSVTVKSGQTAFAAFRLGS
ncbi:Serine/threonine-protein kinase pkn3 [Chondromyces apiculatus DSM 436]|uniref:non-specific serine/threonine protein kinase n=1 Tax=Chondromyces apiculatus DSM 436 TaxID=1192034 RepID=A0A017SXG0_9BACT|nr:Serine/threonine-protein kinase pkn3 [Chondromyces apiculatus DSM 436]